MYRNTGLDIMAASVFKKVPLKVQTFGKTVLEMLKSVSIWIIPAVLAK